MAQVTYRGVKYDTNRPKTSMNNNKKALVYRGVTYDTETRVQEQKTQEPQQLVYRGIAVKGGK